MSRLVRRMKEHIDTYGVSAKADISKATGRGMRTVERWVAKEFIPPALRGSVALACGCTPQEALELAQELPAVEAKKAG